MIRVLDVLRTKVAPLLSFSLLFPIFILTAVIHEVGHAIIALAIGGRVLAIELYQDAAFIRAHFDTQPAAVSYSFFLLGGMLTQYVLGLLIFAFTRKLRPKMFLVNSVALWVILQNLIAPSLSLGSLQGDSFTLASILVGASGINTIPSMMQLLALFLVLVTTYICVKESESFLHTTFQWIKRPKSRVIATLLVISYIAISVIYFFAQFSYPQYFLAIALGITTLSLTIPSASSSAQKDQKFLLRDLVFSFLFFSLISALFLFMTPIFIRF